MHERAASGAISSLLSIFVKNVVTKNEKTRGKTEHTQTRCWRRARFRTSHQLSRAPLSPVFSSRKGLHRIAPRTMVRGLNYRRTREITGRQIEANIKYDIA